jgi:hypothetical protein
VAHRRGAAGTNRKDVLESGPGKFSLKHNRKEQQKAMEKTLNLVLLKQRHKPTSFN